MAKKYTVSEAALRKLVKQLVTEEVEKKWNQPNGPFIDEFQEDPWFYLGEPTPAGDQKNTRSKQQEPSEHPEWQNPFYPEFDEIDSPPFLNRQPKKR
ncbi:hypothetical protein MK805_02595 [Shimazuella sp. AN120528]|uniref:hypothetical protein n=1 Tax=Shimazuella soli TaxID=1892854 RepID=UPI001F0DBCA2|nr:hypothetical protein [Shimazuella soli]MCH5583856.1 hypothetical protein [Shimazuella soli]